MMFLYVHDFIPMFTENQNFGCKSGLINTLFKNALKVNLTLDQGTVGINLFGRH